MGHSNLTKGVMPVTFVQQVISVIQAWVSCLRFVVDIHFNATINESKIF